MIDPIGEIGQCHGRRQRHQLSVVKKFFYSGNGFGIDFRRLSQLLSVGQYRFFLITESVATRVVTDGRRARLDLRRWRDRNGRSD